MSVPRRHALLLICLTSAGWAFSFGLGAPLASRWMDDLGYSSSVIGWNHAAYYLGMAMAAAGTPRLMKRWGSLCVVAGMLISALATAVFPLAPGPITWLALRLISGAAGALSVIPLETYINRDSLPEHRGRNFGCYVLSITVGYSIGNGVGLELFPWLHGLTFAVGGFGAALSAAAVGCWLRVPPDAPESEQGQGRLCWRRNFLSYASAWNQGFLEGGMVAFMNLYLFWLGISALGVFWIVATTMIGIIVFQVPVAWLADQLGKRNVLLGCYGATLIALAILPHCAEPLWLALWLFLVGACSGAFYPLGLALLGESVPAGELAKANAWYLAIECVGCLSGPVAMGYAIDWGGKPAMFTVSLLILGGILAIWLVFHLLERRPVQISATEQDSPARTA